MHKTAAFLGLVGLVTLGCSSDDGDSSTESTFGFTTLSTSASETGDGDGDPGDGDGEPGDGDGAPGDGDGAPGDGDGEPGDGDGEPGDGDGAPGDGDGAPGDGDGDGPIPCAVAEATLAPTTPQVMLVLDKSGSMLTLWDHDNNPNTPTITRWNSLHNVVSFIVNNFDAQMDFGAMLFPSMQATAQYSPAACITALAPEVPVGPDGQAVLAGIPLAGNMTIAGGTPGESAIDVSGTHLKSLDPNLPKAIIYISDGAANCSSDAQTNFQLFEVYDFNLPMTVASLWTNDGIPTYVVGIDISTELTPNISNGNPNNIVPWCKMDELGEVGGKPQNLPPGMSCAETNTNALDFYPASNEIELQAALQTIIEDAISCTIVLDPIPAFPELIEVEIDGTEVPQVEDCATEDGWVYQNPLGPYESIDLCGSWCETLKQTGQADVLYFCVAG